MVRVRRPRLTLAATRDGDARWGVIDAFLTSRPELKPLRAKLAKLLEEVRRLADYGLAEEIEEAGNELRAEMLDQAVAWAFEEGVRASRGRKSR